MYSVTKRMEKILFPDCAGQFSLSPSLTRLPISAIFKHMSDLTDRFPLSAFLFFKPEEFSTSLTPSDLITIPPASLAQNLVTVQEKVLESALILSPHLEDVSLDLRNSENLIHVAIDEKFGPMEVALTEIRDPMERNKLYNDTCLVHESINLLRIKYYHESPSSLVYHTQMYLYAKCQAKWKTGVKMDLPSWTNLPSTSSNVCIHVQCA